jgi:outer membrane protein assembly factor BamB
VWARRGILAAVLVGAALVPGRAGSVTAARCVGQHCVRHTGKIRWTRQLPGSWTTQGGALGTVLSQGQAYAAVGGGVAAVGFGSTVTAYRLTSGQPLWTTGLVGFRAGSAVVSVRAWTGVLTVGVSSPAVHGRAGRRHEVVLSAATGQRIQTYPAAVYGGAVLADETRTVIVGTGAVTSYANASGHAVWRRPTGAVAQAWRAAGGELFVTVAKGGYLGASPVTALRRIDLTSGRQQILRPANGSFAGALSSATGGAVLFSGSAGLTAYSGTDGRLLWQRPGVVPEVADTARQTLYVASGKALIGLNPATNKVVTRSATPGAAGLYAVSDGVALGLDEGALGDAWGYNLARKRVIWTAKAIPWPHFFVDLSGIGGSVGPAGRTVVLASCPQVGVAQVSGGAPPCLRPELVALGP